MVKAAEKGHPYIERFELSRHLGKIIADAGAKQKAGKAKVQVKRTPSKISSEVLKAFIATINSGDIGIYVCLAGFTKEAEDYARNQETRRIKLIDAQEFVDFGWPTTRSSRRKPISGFH